MAWLARIDIYPIKSLDGLAIDKSALLLNGALAGDREFAMFDDMGRYLNAKRDAGVHMLRAKYNWWQRKVTLRWDPTGVRGIFHLDTEMEAATFWLSEMFDRPITFERNSHGGFMDDTEYVGPTIISTATLFALTYWFPYFTVDDLRARFRATLEIGGVPPFWEDRLYTDNPEEGVRFVVGDVEFLGVKPCVRCVVPSRDPVTGDKTPSFNRIFQKNREATLPEWAPRSRFDHFYYLGTNTIMVDMPYGAILRLGDPVRLIGKEKLPNREEWELGLPSA